jgi:hypothetical protein
MLEDLGDRLKDRVNRNIILDMARLWHGPDVIALLSELIQHQPGRLPNATPAGRVG